jgi:hypothetical protein
MGWLCRTCRRDETQTRVILTSSCIECSVIWYWTLKCTEAVCGRLRIHYFWVLRTVRNFLTELLWPASQEGPAACSYKY